MNKLKLNIQKFASQTLLSNKKSTAKSPYCYYTVECTSISNRTATTVNVTIKVTSHLASSSSYFGTGSTYGLTGTIYFNGVTKTLSLKSTSASWSGTGKHSVSKTFTVDCAAAATSLTSIYFKVDRTGSKAGTTDTSAGCWLAKTSCSNITGITQYATTPVFTVNPSISNPAETTATLNLGTATATGDVYYQYKIGDGSYSGNVTGAQSLTGLSAGSNISYSVKAINKLDSTLIAEYNSSFNTYAYPSKANDAPSTISLDASSKSFTLNFNNPLKRTITITAKVGNTSVLSGSATSITLSGTFTTITIDTNKVYPLIPNATYCDLNVVVSANNGNFYTPTIRLNAVSSYAGPTLDISKMQWKATHISPYDVLTTTSMIKSHSYLQIKYTSGLATANKSASISSIKFVFANQNAQTITTAWAPYISTSTVYALTGTIAGVVTITDSRGYTKSDAVAISFVDCPAPTLAVTAARNGYSTNVIFTFAATCGLAAYGNTIKTAYLDTNSSPTTARTLTNNQFTISNIALDASPTYYAKIIDKTNQTSSVVTIKVPKADPTLFIDFDQNGVGINCLPNGDGLWLKRSSAARKVPAVYSGTAAPTANSPSDAIVGDIYIQISS